MKKQSHIEAEERLCFVVAGLSLGTLVFFASMLIEDLAFDSLVPRVSEKSLIIQDGVKKSPRRSPANEFGVSKKSPRSLKM